MKVKFQLLADFFYAQGTPDPLDVSGLVKLGLKNRRLQEARSQEVSIARTLQGERSEFSFQVDLDNDSTSSALQDSAFILYFAMLVGGVYTMW